MPRPRKNEISVEEEAERWLKRHARQLEDFSDNPLKEVLIQNSTMESLSESFAYGGSDSPGLKFWKGMSPDLTFQDLLRQYITAILSESKLSAVQLRVILSEAEGKTQIEIAKKMGKSQQAISKSIAGAHIKIRKTRRRLGGKHNALDFQAIHWWRSMQNKENK
jgi:hypothetical protein